MTRETVDSASNSSVQQKVWKFLKWISHRNSPVRNWRYIPTHLLLRKLRSESSEMRAYAAEGLGGVGDAHAVPPLINALSDNNSTVRRFAISSLGKIRDDRAIDVLIPFLQDGEADMRCAAVVALGELGLSEDRFTTPTRTDNRSTHKQHNRPRQSRLLRRRCCVRQNRQPTSRFGTQRIGRSHRE